MQRRWTWLILILVALAAFWGCSSDDDDPVTPTKTSFQVMAEAGTAYVNDSTTCPGTLAATTLHDNLDAYTVIDIRAEADYLAGHIPGAYNSSLGTLITDLTTTIPAGKPYVIACYSGQSAGHAKIAMEMLGYECYSLAWGMSSWGPATRSPWDNATVNADVTARNQLTVPETTDNNGDLTMHDFPVLTVGSGAVVQERVAAMLTGRLQGHQLRDGLGQPRPVLHRQLLRRGRLLRHRRQRRARPHRRRLPVHAVRQPGLGPDAGEPAHGHADRGVLLDRPALQPDHGLPQHAGLRGLQPQLRLQQAVLRRADRPQVDGRGVQRLRVRVRQHADARVRGRRRRRHRLRQRQHAAARAPSARPRCTTTSTPTP